MKRIHIPIIPPIRGHDKYGSGAFGASRGGRPHKGDDIACYKGSAVLSATEGRVTKIGYPYSPTDEKRGHFRYVQVTTGSFRVRYFYIKPSVYVGDTVKVGDELGTTQGLCDIYPGIIDHFHLEILGPDNKAVNPHEYL